MPARHCLTFELKGEPLEVGVTTVLGRSLLVAGCYISFSESPQSGQRNAVEKRMTKMDELAGEGGVWKIAKVIVPCQDDRGR